MIAAVGRNHEIGCNGDLLCRLPADWQRFREITTGHCVVMGRKTFDSLPNGALPRRTNIVISRRADFCPAGVTVCASLEAAMEVCRREGETEAFIIGGAQIYQQALPWVTKLYLTEIAADFPNADTFFPPLPHGEWREAERLAHPADGRHPYSFDFVVWER